MGNIYIGQSNIARKVGGIYVGVNGVARKVQKAYIGDANGKAREIYSGFDLARCDAYCTWHGNKTQSIYTEPSYGTQFAWGEAWGSYQNYSTDTDYRYFDWCYAQIELSSNYVSQLRANGVTEVTFTLRDKIEQADGNLNVTFYGNGGVIDTRTHSSDNYSFNYTVTLTSGSVGVSTNINRIDTPYWANTIIAGAKIYSYKQNGQTIIVG